MISQIEYSVSFTLDELECNLHSEFLNKLKESLHVESLSHVFVLHGSLGSDIILYKNGSR